MARILSPSVKKSHNAPIAVTFFQIFHHSRLKGVGVTGSCDAKNEYRDKYKCKCNGVKLPTFRTSLLTITTPTHTHPIQIPTSTHIDTHTKPWQINPATPNETTITMDYPNPDYPATHTTTTTAINFVNQAD